MRVYFEGKALGGDSTLLSEYGIQHMSTIQTHVDLMRVQKQWTLVRTEMQSLILDTKDKQRRESKKWLLANF